MLAHADPSYFDTAPTAVSVAWMGLGAFSMILGARVFSFVPFVRPGCRYNRAPWILTGYGLTGYGASVFGRLFDEFTTSQTLWAPIGVTCAFMTLTGGAWLLELFAYHGRQIQDEFDKSDESPLHGPHLPPR